MTRLNPAALALAVLAALALSACNYDDPPTAYVGDCFQVSELVGVVDEIPTVPCDEPHEAEVYANLDLDFDGPYAEVPRRAELTCLSLFADFVGVDITETELDVYYLHPVQEGWEQGDRETICSVIAPDWDSGELQRIEASLAASQR